MIFYIVSKILLFAATRCLLAERLASSLEPFHIVTHLHCVSCGHTALLSDRGECGKGVGGESARETGPGLVRSARRGGAQ